MNWTIGNVKYYCIILISVDNLVSHHQGLDNFTEFILEYSIIYCYENDSRYLFLYLYLHFYNKFNLKNDLTDTNFEIYRPKTPFKCVIFYIKLYGYNIIFI